MTSPLIMTPLSHEVNTPSPTLPSDMLDISKQLSSLQSMLSDMQQRTLPWPSPLPPQYPPMLPHSSIDPTYLIRLIQTHVQNTGTSIANLRAEIATTKVKLNSLSSTASLCNGPMVLASCLLAISLVAILVIVLVSLGLCGILPQVVSLLLNKANAIWSIVSASIITAICLVSVLCMSLIRYNKPLIESTSDFSKNQN